MLISLAVYTFQHAGVLSQSYEDKLRIDSLNMYNNKFTAFEKDLSAQDMVTLINLIKEQNRKNTYENRENIALQIDARMIDVEDYEEQKKIELMENSSTQGQTDIDANYEYILTSDKYNEEGYIVKLRFRTK